MDDPDENWKQQEEVVHTRNKIVHTRFISNASKMTFDQN